MNLQVSIGTVGLKMLAVKAANSSQQTTKSVHENNWQELISMEGPKNLSDHFLEGNSSNSWHDHYDLEIMISTNNGSRNESSVDVQEENNSNYISQPRNVITPQVEKSTTSQNNAKTGHQDSETLSKYSINFLHPFKANNLN